MRINKNVVVKKKPHIIYIHYPALDFMRNGYVDWDKLGIVGLFAPLVIGVFVAVMCGIALLVKETLKQL